MLPVNLRTAPAIAILAVLLTGCGGASMAIKPHTTTLDLNGKSIAIVTVSADNQHRLEYDPYIVNAMVEKVSSDGKSKTLRFFGDSEDLISSGEQRYFVASLPLEPGEYVLRGFLCAYQSFWVRANCFLPVHGNFSAKAGQVSYLGRVTGVIRERADGEFRAGSVIPIVDQAASGFSSGTWDVTISDDFDADMAMMSGHLPVLKGTQIERSALPPFDRAKAQKWWEDN